MQYKNEEAYTRIKRMYYKHKHVMAKHYVAI